MMITSMKLMASMGPSSIWRLFALTALGALFLNVRFIFQPLNPILSAGATSSDEESPSSVEQYHFRSSSPLVLGAVVEAASPFSAEQQENRYPQPLYGNLQNATLFRQVWEASHTRHYPKLVLRESSSAIQGMSLLQNPPNMLLGILSFAGSRERRKMIRETMLHFYHDVQGAPNFNHHTTDNNHKICSLMEYSSQLKAGDCRLAYVFVVAGGSDDAPTMRLSHHDKTTPLTVARPPGNQDEPDDVIYLNIRENMNEGKVPTWFYYASRYLNETQNLQFDYIAKMDDDTLLFTGTWMDILERRLPRPDSQLNTDGLVYGGTPNLVFDSWKGNKKCQDGNFTKCPLIGPLWMVGPFYFLSYNLADYSTSHVIPHETLQSYEDVATATYVFSHPRNVKLVVIPKDRVLWSYDYHRNYAQDSTGLGRFDQGIYGHSEVGCWNPKGPYFKRLSNVRKVWREYLVYLWSGRPQQREPKTLPSRYQLYDFPVAIRSKKNTKNKNVKTANGTSSVLQQDIVVHPSDYIYSSDDFDASPIVMEKPYPLVFFPVSGAADVVWRCLIRRLLGYSDWSDPTRQFDGLSYLSNYTVDQATEIMFSSKYTKAIFVRDPLERIQSNYIQLLEHDPDHVMVQPCNCFRNCYRGYNPDTACRPVTRTFDIFLKKLVPDCHQPYWRPQAYRMEPKYWQVMDFVGHYEQWTQHALELFRRISAAAAAQAGRDTDSFSDNEWMLDESELTRVFSMLDVSYSAKKAPKKLFARAWMDIFQDHYGADLKMSVLMASDVTTTQNQQRHKTK